MSAVSLPSRQQSAIWGAWLLVVAAGLSLLFTLVAYFTPHGPIAQAWGTLLVVVSTALMFGAALWIALAGQHRGLRILFQVLIILDIAGTAVCAYFLEAYVLLFLTVLALIGWIAHLNRPSPAARAT